MRKIYFLLVLLFFGSASREQTTLLSANFNSTPPGWQATSNSFGGNTAASDWTLRSDGYTYDDNGSSLNETFHSNDLTQFYLSNSDAQHGMSTQTLLQSSAFSTVGFTTVTVDLYHNFKQNVIGTGFIEASDDGINWVTEKNFSTTQGTASLFSHSTFTMNDYAGLPTVYIRFRYYAESGYYWAIDNVTVIGSNSPLPISLINFSGYREGNHNLLKWTTASEQNNKGFVVERSTDGINYSSIGFVDSRGLNGNSSTQLHYAFVDNALSGLHQYYRLRQMDFDNNEKVSNTILIKGQRPATLSIGGLFPNPANNVIHLMIDSPGSDQLNLEITDINGKKIKQISAGVDSGTNALPLNIAELAEGIYFVKIVSKFSNEILTAKFIKK